MNYFVDAAKFFSDAAVILELDLAFDGDAPVSKIWGLCHGLLADGMDRGVPQTEDFYNECLASSINTVLDEYRAEKADQ